MALSRDRPFEHLGRRIARNPELHCEIRWQSDLANFFDFAGFFLRPPATMRHRGIYADPIAMTR